MTNFSIGSVEHEGRAETVLVLGDEAFALAPVLTGGTTAREEAGLDDMLQHWAEWLPRLKAVADDQASLASARLGKTADLTWLPPIRRPRKLICMGTNYAGHASEVSSDPLAAPYAFLKSADNTLRGSGATIRLLDIAQMNDWEVELGVVIGREARRVSESEALDVVAGYTIINDVSARDWVASSPRFLGIDWVVGKSIDGYAPMGPTFTPAEFVADPQDLDLELTVNGRIMQSGNTRQMIFGVARIIAHLSRYMTLAPGDIIATGTPEGTGFGRKPPVFIQDGDVIECTIAGLGRLRNTFVR